MAGFGEPWDWTTDRNQRMESEYPELANTSADDVLGTDNYAVSQGHAPTQFSSTAMGLGAHSVVSQETEDNSWWGAIKRAGSSILALDTPISERLGYKVPEGSGPADELANFALEESTRPTNIALALGGFFTGGISTAGAATNVSLGAAARVAARAAAKNVAMGVGGRVAAAGVEKVSEYAPEEIGPLAGLASAGAGLYATRGRSGLTRTAAALAAGGIGYASPELAGGIAGGVLTHKAIGGFSSWKEAANSIENRAATQAETQAAQLLEQAEASKQRMRDLAAAERRGETRIASDRMPEIPMGQEWEQNGLGQVAYKTSGDDVKALAIQVAKDIGEEIPADMAARARNAIASGEQNLLTNSAIELNNWRGVIGPDNKRIILPTARRRVSPTFQNTPELKAADKAFKEASIEGERRRVLTEAAQKETGNRATYVGETGEIRLGQNLKEARMIAEANADKGPIGKYLKGDDSALQAAADLRVSKSGTAYGYSAEGRAAQASAIKAAKEGLIADRAVYESATGTSATPVVEAATTPKITAADRRAALRTAPEVKPNEELLAQDAARTAEAAAAPVAEATAPAAPKLNYLEIPKGAEPAGRTAEPVPTAKPLSKAQKSAFAESENIRSAFDTDQVSGLDSLQEIPEGAIGKDGYGGFWRFKNGKAQRFKETTNQFSSTVKREHSDTVKWSKYSPDDAIQNAPAVEPHIARAETPVDWIPQLRSTGGEINADGTVTVYHTTTRKNAEKIIKDGVLRGARKDDGVWVSTSPDAARDYAPWGKDGVTIQMNIKASDLTPDLNRFNSMNQIPYQNRLDMFAKTKNGSYKPASIGDIREIDVAPAAAQQVDTPVTPAAGGGEVPPVPPRGTATGGASGFEGKPQSSRDIPTWSDNAAHNKLTAKTIPIIDQYQAAAAETTESVATQNKKLQDVANRQAEKVRIAALDEGKTKLEANLLWLEEWNKANSGERIKPEFDLPLGLSDREADRIKESFVNAMRATPDNLFIVYRVKEATPALAAITGKGPLAYKSQYDALLFWINAMSPEEELAYLKNQFKNKKGGFNPKNAQLLKDKATLLDSELGFAADDIADGVPAGSAGRVAADEAAAPRQTGEPTARPVDEPTAGTVDESINRPVDELTGEPVVEPTVAPDDGAGATADSAEVPGTTGGGGKGRGKGAGKGGGKDGGASSTGDDIEGVPEANDYGKSFRKSVQEIKEAKGVNTFWNILTDVLAAPRSLKASFDLSAAGRQAATYGYSHPGQALKAFKAQLKAYGSEAGYQESVERLANKPWAGIRDEVVANSLVDQPLLNGERTFISKGLNKVPGFRASERAYATYLNELRDSAFEMMWRNSGLSLEELTSVTNVPKVKAWGDLINASTGHGDIGALFNAKVAGNPILWAPNFLYSRVKLPWIALTQWHKNPEVALEAAKQLGIFVGVNSALLAGVNASGAASVELDPRSSDFGQMRIGNSRIDPWAGYRPIANLIARLQSGQTKSTTTGDISDPTNLKIVQDFLRNKMEPLSGEILNQILGSNSIGEPTAADTNMAIRLVAPLFLESMVRAINVGGPSVTPSENFSDQIASFGRNVASPGGLKAAALTLPGVLGVGTATYEPLIKKMDRATLDKMSPQERNNFLVGEQRGLANLTPAEQQKVIPALAFRRMYETMPSATQELSNYGSFSGFKRDKIREYAEYYIGIGMSKANSVLRAEQQFQNSGYQQIYQKHVNYLKYQWSEAHPGTLAEEIEETYTINPRDRTFRPNAMQKAMAEPYLEKR